jgi:hypothetical protein
MVGTDPNRARLGFQGEWNDSGESVVTDVEDEAALGPGGRMRN